jgi:hypothetical protein
VEIDISTFIASRLGTAIHNSIEKAWKTNYRRALHLLGYSQKMIDRVLINPTAEELAAADHPIPVYIEQRAEKELDGYIVHGGYDFIGDGYLEDFKSTGVYSYIHKSNRENHRLQGSIYRWLDPEKITSDHMLVQYAFTDWSKLQAMIQKDKGYPQSRLVTDKIPLLSMEDTERYIRQKIAEIEHFKTLPEAEMPFCTKEELWQSDTVYKYFSKPDAKRSSGNFDNYYEAHLKMTEAGKGFVKEFPGEVRRCGYCPAYDLCTQKDIYLTEGILVLP